MYRIQLSARWYYHCERRLQCLCCMAALMFLCSVLSVRSKAQEARPALITSSQSGGAATNTGAPSVTDIGGLSDSPIAPGDVVHVLVFAAPDFSTVTRVSESGDIAFPILGVVHIGGLDSETASNLIAGKLKTSNLMLNPHVTVTVDSSATGITVLGEVRAPGVYPPPGKRMLSDLLATAGGLTSNTGRVIEISNDRTPDKKVLIPWDPTMHNTANFDRPVHAGDRVYVRACGIAYVGGNVVKPGAYSLCGSPTMTLSEVIALAGGVAPLSAPNHTYLVRAQPGGTRVVRQIDIKKILESKEADPIVKEDDIIYISPSALKQVANRALGYAVSLAGPLLYVTAP